MQKQFNDSTEHSITFFLEKEREFGLKDDNIYKKFLNEFNDKSFAY